MSFQIPTTAFTAPLFQTIFSSPFSTSSNHRKPSYRLPRLPKPPRRTMAPILSISEAELESNLSQLRAQDPETFDRIAAVVKFNAMESRPLFPKVLSISEIPKLDPADMVAFKEKYVDMSYIKDYNSPEAKERLVPSTKVRDTQYERWQWACKNFETYVNMLRVCDHSDESIQAMIDGRPLCFRDDEILNDLKVALRELKPELEKEMGWASVGFILTGSSVPGFSQNPVKGKQYEPTRITSASSSDVDLCIKGDGVELFVHKLRQQDIWTRSYPTTCSATRTGTRFGIDRSILNTGALGKFYTEWGQRLEGGLQLTFCEDSLDIPPWEMPVL